jgi:hypothetical protein
MEGYGMSRVKPILSSVLIASIAGCATSSKAPPSTAPATQPTPGLADVSSAGVLTGTSPTLEKSAGEDTGTTNKSNIPSTKPADPQPTWTFAPRRPRTPIESASVDPSTRPEIQNTSPSADPPAAFRRVVTLTVFQCSVRAGSLSRNDNFWKHADENAVDVSTHDILDRNGIRVAVAPLKDFDYFAKYLDIDPRSAKPPIYAAPGVKPFEIMMKHAVPGQILYYFDLDGNMPIRGYDNCDNIFCVEFQPAPRKADAVRVGLCPMVRSARKRLRATGDGEIAYVSDERYFDLNLQADLPIDQFLIVAPGSEAKAPMSIGNAFLVHEGNTQKYEDVILIIPQAAISRPEKPSEAAPGAGH